MGLRQCEIAKTREKTYRVVIPPYALYEASYEFDETHRTDRLVFLDQ